MTLPIFSLATQFLEAVDNLDKTAVRATLLTILRLNNDDVFDIASNITNPFLSTVSLHLTALIVVCAYIVTRMPYGVRTSLASFQQIGRSMEESSKTLGATSALTIFKVIVPLVMPGLAAGSIMVFISAMQDVAVTLMTCPPDWYPASVFVFLQIQEGNVFDASAYGIILFGLILIPYSIAWKIGVVKGGM